MGNCLVTKLKGAVNNPNLPYFNELRLFNKAVNGTPKIFDNCFGCSINAEVTIKSVDGTPCFILANNPVGHDDIPSSGYVAEATGTAGSLYIIFANVDCEVVILSKNALVNIFGLSYDNNTKNFGFSDINQIIYMESLTGLQEGGMQSANGILRYPEGAPAVMQSILIGIPWTTTDIGVDISTLPSSVVDITLDSTKSVGDLPAFVRNHLNFTEINVMRTQVTGDVGDLCEAFKDVVVSLGISTASFQPALSSHMTLREGYTHDNRYSFATTDGGTTFVVSELTGEGAVSKGTYNTSTHTWSD